MFNQIYVALLVLLSTASHVSGQVSLSKPQPTVYRFTSGLMALTGSRYGREAIYSDPLAYQLYTHTLKQPTQGGSFGVDEQGRPIQWLPVTADSLNRLRLRTNARGNGGAPAGPGVTPGSLRGGIGGGGGYAYLTYASTRAQVAVLNIKGNSTVYVNGEPHMGDAYSMGYLHIPVKLKKGLNEFYVRGTAITASLEFPQATALLRTDDPTVPSIRLNEPNTALQAAIVILNTSDKPLAGLTLKSSLSGREATTPVPSIPAMSTRKVAFTIDGSTIKAPGSHSCTVTLLQKGKSLDESTVALDAVAPASSYNVTFTSHIDGSLQYYAVTPSSSTAAGPAALFLSVHGAGVEASGQARAYKPKDWGTLVAATNRRPRGFNWEDWGRLDALEVLALANNRFKPDPHHIYLTGHSMGGHGTWFLGATYPDKWAAIAPCAGYPTLKEYGSADGLIPDSSSNPLEQVLLQAGNQSDVLKLVSNYKPLGVYIFHGDADRTVPVTYARQMRKLLGGSQPDMSYYEYPGGSHWFGDHSVDWNPLFDFFKWHQTVADSSVNTIDFTTANPGISSAYRWASIDQQVEPLAYSRIQFQRTAQAITGTTTNVAVLKLALTHFGANKPVSITLDGLPAIEHRTTSASDTLLLRRGKDRWVAIERLSPAMKGPHRNGTFKDAFTHRMVFVYGTAGNTAENEWAYNKARFDAETWYYRGNGAVEIVADNAFDPALYKDRGVILFGNQTTNRAWPGLLATCPIQVTRGELVIGNERYKGDGFGAYFIWPRADSQTASVGVVTGTGLPGLNAANANQYFAGGSGFPDYMVFDISMLRDGVAGVKTAGFFDNNWALTNQAAPKP
ncbi:alpha/beta hydrolase-fold protein [Spirosoma utsteinense]|uniref:Poly(3-hydroxybutyrate) depolymerase n=1 Tax=Spirosoma utsteinense TaxID=2585773 RepID=A0ABR6W5B4_9BACT|nr:prolyl oligopeptidase family serine peptidase [Spirosoma utsteinense]MBC3785638.1 poly(3-hydroxybutyrate) depolymerase [Spirosoma utsteinense]MBC3791789.1 poly(3-hydroxybutyrate) depolymerase [Spirosoma utsteinense]